MLIDINFYLVLFVGYNTLKMICDLIKTLILNFTVVYLGKKCLTIAFWSVVCESLEWYSFVKSVTRLTILEAVGCISVK